MQDERNKKTLLDYALIYRKKGFSIFPLQKNSKKPAIPRWTPYRSRVASLDKINEWFSTSNYNIAMVTGDVSASFAIDIDGQSSYDDFIDKIMTLIDDDHLRKAVDETMKINTGSGNTNFIFRFDPKEFPKGENIPNSLLWKDPTSEHCEIRLIGDGKYIVLPPSVHPNNKEYTLVNGINPVLLTRKQIQKLIDLFSKRNFSTEEISKVLAILKPYYKNGSRNDLVVYLSGWLRKLGISFELAERIITELAGDDEEKKYRIRTLHETFKKKDLKKISGYSGLIKLLSCYCSEKDAKEKLKKLEEIFAKYSETTKGTKKKERSTKKKERIDIISLIKRECLELFVDQFNKPYIAINIKEHVEILGVDSQRFKNWLFKFFLQKSGELSTELVENIIKVLKSEAEFNENKKKLELRVSKVTKDNDNIFYYDLTNSECSAVKITSQGWSIEKKPPILFRRYSNQLSQINPASSLLPIDDKDNKIFDKYIDLLNIKDDDDTLLLKCYIVSLFIPGISKPILMLHGEQGSAKTTLQELIKMLVDPSIVKTLTFPRDINELVQQLSHNYVAFYENLSSIKEWISDTLCRAVTGSGFSKRQLYTDDEDIIYFFQRCIGFNGINLAATKADLLDRGIIIELERIPKKNRRKAEDIWNDFQLLRSQLLGYIFGVLVKVLQLKQKGGIKISGGLNRMADFEEYSEIISRCMGYPEGEFLRVYQENINIQIDEALEASPLSMAVLWLVGQGGQEDTDEVKEWLGTATELSLVLNEIAESELKINIQKIRFWPKSPNSLSRRLNEIKTNLREKGIEILKIKDSKGNRLIKICKISSKPSNRQESQNHEQNKKDTLDDFQNNQKVSSKISSNKKNENQEQDSEFGRYGDIDDDLHTKELDKTVEGNQQFIEYIQNQISASVKTVI